MRCWYYLMWQWNHQMWEKSKGTTKCKKRTITCDVGTAQCKNGIKTYVFHMLRTYVMILFNWLILWQNALYLYVGRLRMCLTTSRNHVSRNQEIKKPHLSLFKKSSKECKIVKARQLVDTFSTPPICQGLRTSYFNSDFLGIRESVYGPFFS